MVKINSVQGNTAIKKVNEINVSIFYLFKVDSIKNVLVFNTDVCDIFVESHINSYRPKFITKNNISVPFEIQSTIKSINIYRSTPV
jgi:hypothetical protein